MYITVEMLSCENLEYETIYIYLPKQTESKLDTQQHTLIPVHVYGTEVIVLGFTPIQLTAPTQRSLADRTSLIVSSSVSQIPHSSSPIPNPMPAGRWTILPLTHFPPLRWISLNPSGRRDFRTASTVTTLRPAPGRIDRGLPWVMRHRSCNIPKEVGAVLPLPLCKSGKRLCLPGNEQHEQTWSEVW
jgi:hypothetical protein